ncbi:alpha/beta hydrolase [Streptomyces albus subsp. chlorinus]|uniref:alpha/beta fold hydrolase n=1 Tax=Streptomyces albus TaxID=1888 RepID=UPI00156D89FC|nr:alpha/beta hydrolase [Streptomyces albus]NSC20493.1 alpha/beta hydrolase [Streptomyces albus subsp. chlorinus]
MSENGTRTVHTGGVRLVYRAWGAEAGVPVVLLHCLGEDGEDWRGPLISALGGEHPVYALDLRGHGGSDWPGSYAMADFTGDLLGFLDALGLDKAVLVGHSFGSVVAYLFAQEHPGRVDRLVLEETVAMRPLETPQEVPEEPPPGTPRFDREAGVQWARQRNDPDPRWWERLGAVTAPTLLLGGGDGSHLPQEDLHLMAERIPDARVLTVDGAGHLVHEARPMEFTRAVVDFLAES